MYKSNLFCSYRLKYHSRRRIRWRLPKYIQTKNTIFSSFNKMIGTTIHNKKQNTYFQCITFICFIFWHHTLLWKGPQIGKKKNKKCKGRKPTNRINKIRCIVSKSIVKKVLYGYARDQSTSLNSFYRITCKMHRETQKSDSANCNLHGALIQIYCNIDRLSYWLLLNNKKQDNQDWRFQKWFNLL